MNCSSRRAMTLIEVLAATVLLAILGSVCALMLRSVPVVTTKTAAGATSIDMPALERAADELLSDSSLRKRLIADASAELRLPWPDDRAWQSMQIRRVECESTDGKSEHAWVAFYCDKLIVWRRIELPRENPAP